MIQVSHIPSDLYTCRYMYSMHSLIVMVTDTGIYTGFFCRGGNSSVRQRTEARGVWGHAPPYEKFEIYNL